MYVEEVKVENGFAVSTGSQDIPEEEDTFAIEDFEDAGDAW